MLYVPGTDFLSEQFERTEEDPNILEVHTSFQMHLLQNSSAAVKR